MAYNIVVVRETGMDHVEMVDGIFQNVDEYEIVFADVDKELGTFEYMACLPELPSGMTWPEWKGPGVWTRHVHEKDLLSDPEINALRDRGVGVFFAPDFLVRTFTPNGVQVRWFTDQYDALYAAADDYAHGFTTGVWVKVRNRCELMSDRMALEEALRRREGLSA